MYRTCNRTSIDTALHHERHDTECTHGKYLCVLMIVAFFRVRSGPKNSCPRTGIITRHHRTLHLDPGVGQTEDKSLRLYDQERGEKADNGD
jgi:hypothetical protein